MAPLLERDVGLVVLPVTLPFSSTQTKSNKCPFHFCWMNLIFLGIAGIEDKSFLHHMLLSGLQIHAYNVLVTVWRVSSEDTILISLTEGEQN